jgi:hypothetical protein
LTSEFSDLAKEGENIAAQQAQYAKARRQKVQQHGTNTLDRLDKKYESPEKTRTTPSPFANVASFEKYELISEASNKATRTLTRIMNPTMGYGTGAKRRRHRMVMLKKCTKVYKMLGKMQEIIISPINTFANVKDAYDLAHDVLNEWHFVENTFDDYEKLMSVPVLEKPESNKEKPIDSKENEITEIKNDITSISGGKIYGASIFAPIVADINSYNVSEDLDKKSDIADTIISKYKDLLKLIGRKFGVTGKSLKDIENAVGMLKLPSQKPEDQLEAAAQSFIKKWIGRARHNLIPNDSSDYRLMVYDLAQDGRHSLNQLMNLLERRKTAPEEMAPIMKNINKDITDIRVHVYNLYRVVNRNAENKKK